MLTDLEDILDNLKHNTEVNRPAIEALGGRIAAAILDWYHPELSECFGKRFEVSTVPNSCSRPILTSKIIIAADPLYDPDHPLILAKTVDTFLSKNIESRVIMAIPIRDKATRALADTLDKYMQDFSIMIRKIEICKDDWGHKDGEDTKLEWTVWRRCLKKNPPRTEHYADIGGCGLAVPCQDDE